VRFLPHPLQATSLLTLTAPHLQGKSYFNSASDSAKAEYEKIKSSLSSAADDAKAEGKAWLSWGENKVDQARAEVNRAAYKTEAEFEAAKEKAKAEVRSIFPPSLDLPC
jgi:F0F1-type ATP synthase membrane subunit b/b'